MPAPRDHRHVVVPGAPRTEAYRRHDGGGGGGDLPPDPESFKAHADRLTAELKGAQAAAEVCREAATAAGYDVKARGIVLEFASPPGFELELASLENVRAGIELLCVRPIDPALLDVLYELCQALAYDGPIHVISGYRSPATNAMLASRSTKFAKNSYHTRGRAIDIRMPGRRLVDVRDAAIRLARGGVGYYPRSDFVHLDTGPPRHW